MARLGVGTARGLLGDLAYRPGPLGGTLGMGAAPAKTLVGFAARIAAKVRAHARGCYVNRMPGRPRGRIEELWARHLRNAHLARRAASGAPTGVRDSRCMVPTRHPRTSPGREKARSGDVRVSNGSTGVFLRPLCRRAHKRAAREILSPRRRGQAARGPSPRGPQPPRLRPSARHGAIPRQRMRRSKTSWYRVGPLRAISHTTSSSSC